MRLDIDTAHDLIRPFFSMSPLTSREDFFVDATFAVSGQIIGVDFAYSTMRIERDPSRVNAYDTEFLILETYRKGITRGLLADHGTLVSKGVVHIMDWSRAYRAVMKGASGIGIQIPHDLIGYDPSRHPAYRAFDTTSGLGRLLAFSLDTLIDCMKGSSQGDTEDLSAAVLGLVRHCLLGDWDGEHVPSEDSGRQHLVKAFITQNLDRGELGVGAVCRALGLSRATLYRTFGAGGVEAFIREARLERAFSELLSAQPQRGVVGAVAARWGFVDVGNFGRAFRTRFGFSPSDCLAVGFAELPETGVGAHPVHQLLRERRSRRALEQGD